MKRKHYPWLLGAVALTAGCAQAPIAKTDAEPAIKVAPVYRVQQPAGTAAGQYAVGRIDLAEGRVGAAIKRFQQALQLDSGFVEAHNGLGVAYGQQGRYAEAAAAFRAALALSPESPHVLNNLGFAQLKAGQLEDAAASLDRSLALDSGNQRTRENLALLVAARTAVASALASAATPASPAVDRGSSAAPAVAVPAAPVVPAVIAAAPAVAAPVATAPTAPAPTVAAPATSASRPALTIQPVAVPQVVSRPAFEVVVSRSNESALVQVAPNVYELRQGEAIAAASPAPAVASAQSHPISVVARSAPTAASATPEFQAPVAAPAVAATPVAATPVVATPVVATPVVATPVAEPVAAATKPSTPEPIAVAPVLAQPLAPSPQPDANPVQAKAADSEPPKAQQAQVIQPPPVTQFSLAARPLSPAKRPASTASLGGLGGLEVSNGVGIRHLAGRTARSLSQLGVTVARVSDYRLFGRQRTEIHYRSGHVEQAMAVRTSLPVGARLVRTDRLHPSVNVRLVIGKDLVERRVAWLGEDVLTADVEEAGGVIRPPVAAGKGLDLAAHAGKVARADVENGWRYL